MNGNNSDSGASIQSYWYHGFDYNATPGSRAQITTVLAPGMILAHDPEAYTDDYTYQNSGSGSSNLPSGTDYGQMVLYPPAGTTNNARLIRNVTRPATALLYVPAGVIKSIGQDRRAWGSQSAGAGPQWVELYQSGEVVDVLCTWSGITPAVGDWVVPTAGSFYGNFVAQADAVAIGITCAIGRVISTLGATGSALGSSGTAAAVKVRLGAFGLPLSL